jgi:hypothetical protein
MNYPAFNHAIAYKIQSIKGPEDLYLGPWDLKNTTIIGDDGTYSVNPAQESDRHWHTGLTKCASNGCKELGNVQLKNENEVTCVRSPLVTNIGWFERKTCEAHEEGSR